MVLVLRLAGVMLVLAFVVLSDAALLPRNFASKARPATDEEEVPVPPDMWFTQYLDHFNITDNREWKQRYLVMKDYYKEGSAVFLKVGEEYKIDGAWLPYYAVTEYAKKFNAMVFLLEHRFYGLSRPTKDLSTENLIYLSTDQALADIAYFIKGMYEEHKLPANTKWILFGASYAGNLAAWMREKYSHLVYAAVADSAPVKAKVNFFEYMGVVKEALARFDPDCVTNIQEAHKKFKELLKTTEGQLLINQKFKLCDPIDVGNKDAVYSLYGVLSSNLGAVVQSNTTSYLTIDEICTVMLNKSISDVFDRYAEVNSIILDYDGNDCLSYTEDKFIEDMKNTSWESTKAESGTRQWVYTTCTECGYFQTSVAKDQLYFEDVPLYLPLQECKDIFGDIFGKDLAYKGEYRTNLMYGGLEGQATRVAYIYCENDPWHALGNNKTVIKESPVIFIKGASHGVLQSPIRDYYSENIKKAWYQVQDIVGGWCKE